MHNWWNNLRGKAEVIVRKEVSSRFFLVYFVLLHSVALKFTVERVE